MTHRIRLLAIPLLALSAAPLSAQVPAGGEFRVNTYTTGEQWNPAVASDAAGHFVVVWDSPGHDGDGRGLFGQRYDAAGSPRGLEFQANTFTTGEQWQHSAAMDAAGNFVVAWTNGVSDPAWRGIFARRFESSGTERGLEFRVSTSTASSQGPASVASDPVGNFIVVWQAWPDAPGPRVILGQRYDASGAPRGANFFVFSDTSREGTAPAVAVDQSGNCVVTWTGHDGSEDGIYGRRFDASGSPTGPDFRVNTFTPGHQAYSSVASSPTGDTIVTWMGGGIFAQLYDRSGLPRGAELRISPVTWTPQSSPSATTDHGGNFVVAWSDYAEDGSIAGVMAQRVDVSGMHRGSPFRINTYTSGAQHSPSVASDAAGNLVAAWGSGDQDGSANGIYAQRYGGLVPAAMRADPYPSGVSDGNDVLEPNENVGVWTWWRNVNGQAQTFGGEGLSFVGPAGSGVTYYLIDAPGAYGTVANGATAACLDCYAVGVVSGVRPAVHWDATFKERLTPDAHGQTKLWSMHIGDSFADVPRTSGYYRFVETLLHKGVTGGCTAASYCPLDAVTREQLSVFVLAGKEGKGYLPQACGTTPVFADVPASSPFCRFVEDLSRRGVVSGCGGGNYCPSSAVTREQMPVFVLRTLEPTLDPPACGTPIFADVPASSPFCRWIHELARRGVVSGCGGGNYCPSDPVTREQMAVFIGVTFGLSLYGP